MEYNKKGKVTISEAETTYLKGSSFAIAAFFSNKASYCIRPERNSECVIEKESPVTS